MTHELLFGEKEAAYSAALLNYSAHDIAE